MMKKGNNYFKTENNQKIIFNNIGINYHKTKFNNQKIKKSFDKKDLNSIKEVDKVNDNIKGLIIKNNKNKNEKSEKDNKIEILEQKIDKLINFIKNNETLNLKHKINTLQNDIEILKKENEKLKSELEAKNEIISSLENKQNQIIYQNNEIIDKIRSNKEKGQKIKNRNYDIDLDKLKLISIDPDDI
jgi:chromosome segregation ATPase